MKNRVETFSKNQVGYTGSKIQVRNRLKIKFVQLDFWKKFQNRFFKNEVQMDWELKPQSSDSHCTGLSVKQSAENTESYFVKLSYNLPAAMNWKKVKKNNMFSHTSRDKKLSWKA